MPCRKHALVTGCSRGLGLAIARRLVHEGYCVGAICRRQRDADRVVRLLGARCTPFELDLAQGEAGVRVATARVLEWLQNSKLALVVNNAGNSYDNWDEASWVDSRAVNYTGAVLLTQGLLPALAHGASVVMVGSGLGESSLLSPKFQRLLAETSSIAALDSIADLPLNQLNVQQSWVGPYGLSKALLHRAVEILAADGAFKGGGVAVNAVCPGWVSTDMGGEQAPISADEGAGHVLDKVLHLVGGAVVTGTFKCYCYKNYDDEHTKAWEKKWGAEEDACVSHAPKRSRTDQSSHKRRF